MALNGQGGKAEEDHVHDGKKTVSLSVTSWFHSRSLSSTLVLPLFFLTLLFCVLYLLFRFFTFTVLSNKQNKTYSLVQLTHCFPLCHTRRLCLTYQLICISSSLDSLHIQYHIHPKTLLQQRTNKTNA
ncbi:hypothetical protein NW765_003778 [Fusarium oxysporum]|nr:hypothetical protein NW765_003778 [Fusarium oxysporum]KAJ4283264.1 hypothetical protein NW764_002665 [Fusarium oxysporum]